ncbi:MAG: hypothetical protein ABEN55_16795 [Bradymonadaceae bacterium]
MHPLCLLSFVLLFTLTTTGCDRSSNDAESTDERATASASRQAMDEASTDYPDADRAWLGRLDEHKGRILVDLGELDGGEDGLNGSTTFDSAGDAPFNAQLLPEPYRDLEKVDVLTTEGTVHLDLDQISRDAIGPSDFQLRLQTAASEELTDKLEEWTLVGPAGGFADGAALEPVEAKPAHAKAVPKLRSHVMGELTSDQRDKFATGFAADGDERSLGTGHIATVTGEFPSPRAKFVAVNGPTGTGGVQGQQFPFVRALLFATDTGEVTDTLAVMFGPDHAHGHAATARAEAIAVADPDGDDTHGVLYRADDAVKWVDFQDGTLVHP